MNAWITCEGYQTFDKFSNRRHICFHPVELSPKICLQIPLLSRRKLQIEPTMEFRLLCSSWSLVDTVDPVLLYSNLFPLQSFRWLIAKLEITNQTVQIVVQREKHSLSVMSPTLQHNCQYSTQTSLSVEELDAVSCKYCAVCLVLLYGLIHILQWNLSGGLSP